MSEIKPKSSWFTGCLGKFVFWVWLLAIGAVGGVWLGINVDRMYPGLSVPSVPMIENIVDKVPFVESKIRTPDNLIISISNSTREGKDLKIFFNVTNDGDRPIELNYDTFYLMDKQNKLYDKTFISQDLEGTQYMLSFLDPLNPGLSKDYRLVFAVPNNVKNFNLYYENTKIGKVQ